MGDVCLSTLLSVLHHIRGLIWVSCYGVGGVGKQPTPQQDSHIGLQLMLVGLLRVPWPPIIGLVFQREKYHILGLTFELHVEA